MEHNEGYLYVLLDDLSANGLRLEDIKYEPPYQPYYAFLERHEA